MRDKTRELLEKNQSLVRELSKMSPFQQKITDKKNPDIVDKFFDNQLKCDLNEVSEIVENNIFFKNMTYRDEDALTDVEALNDFIAEAWSAYDCDSLSLVTYKVATKYFSGWYKFTINPEGNIANGAFGVGNVKQFKDIIEAIKVPLPEQSVLRDVLITGEMFKGALTPNLWNNFIANRLMPNVICPEVIALPVFESENSIKEIILSSALRDNYSAIKENCLKIYIFQMRKIIKSLSFEKIISNLST